MHVAKGVRVLRRTSSRGIPSGVLSFAANYHGSREFRELRLIACDNEVTSCRLATYVLHNSLRFRSVAFAGPINRRDVTHVRIAFSFASVFSAVIICIPKLSRIKHRLSTFLPNVIARESFDESLRPFLSLPFFSLFFLRFLEKQLVMITRS